MSYDRVKRNEDKPHRCPTCHRVCCRAGRVRLKWHRCHDCIVTWWGGWR